MRWNRCLPALALLLFLPARADEGATKAPPQGDAKPAEGKVEKMSCCAGEEGGEKALCPKGKAKVSAAGKKNATKPKAAVATAPEHQTAAPPAPAPGAANMVVTRDPETGELRNATGAEREKLVGRRPLATPEPQVVTLPDGTRMMRLGPEHASLSVARKNPDGTLTSGCVHGTAEARAFVEEAPGPVPAPAAREK